MAPTNTPLPPGTKLENTIYHTQSLIGKLYFTKILYAVGSTVPQSIPTTPLNNRMGTTGTGFRLPGLSIQPSLVAQMLHDHGIQAPVFGEKPLPGPNNPTGHLPPTTSFIPDLAGLFARFQGLTEFQAYLYHKSSQATSATPTPQPQKGKPHPETT